MEKFIFDLGKEKLSSWILDVVNNEQVASLNYKEDTVAETFSCNILYTDGTEIEITRKRNYHRVTHEECRSRIVKTFLENRSLSGREIAKIVGCTESTVRRNLAKEGYKLQGGK